MEVPFYIRACLQGVTTAEGVTQVREFTYDNRAFLISEMHPEKGPNGHGLVKYFDYGARGHAGRRADTPNHLTFLYDRSTSPEEPPGAMIFAVTVRNMVTKEGATAPVGPGLRSGPAGSGGRGGSEAGKSPTMLPPGQVIRFFHQDNREQSRGTLRLPQCSPGRG